MDDSMFPQLRANGSLSVAIRYSMSDRDTIRAAQRVIADWIQSKLDLNHYDVVGDLGQAPTVNVVDPETIQVVLDCQSSSTLWKGFMIELTIELDKIPGTRRLGFWDLVAGQPHPASIGGQ